MQNEQTSKSESSKKIGKTETISELAHRHLSDESHTTSDEELRNATVEFSETPQLPEDNLFELDNAVLTDDGSDSPKDIDDDHDKPDEDKHDNPPNPYSVLGP